jgi:uncharacterized protein with von Willebrand factor type A (vWA) domain
LYTELDDYAAQLRATRPLTAAEEKELKRQRRLIKNRESAYLSRQRRKEHLDDLEELTANLREENAKLRSLVESLSAENAQLKEHIQRLQQNEQAPTVSERIKRLTSIKRSSSFASKASATAGACLTVCCF